MQMKAALVGLATLVWAIDAAVGQTDTSSYRLYQGPSALDTALRLQQLELQQLQIQQQRLQMQQQQMLERQALQRQKEFERQQAELFRQRQEQRAKAVPLPKPKPPQSN